MYICHCSFKNLSTGEIIQEQPSGGQTSFYFAWEEETPQTILERLEAEGGLPDNLDEFKEELDHCFAEAVAP